MNPAINWADLAGIATVATAVIALLALLVAAWAARATIQTNRAQQQTLELQRRQYSDNAEQLRRSQAEKIAIWILNPRPGDVRETFRAFVSNASDSPIYYLSLIYQDALESLTDLSPLAFVEVVLPTGEIPIEIDVDWARIEPDDVRIMAAYFSDAAGRGWRRGLNGKLSEESQETIGTIHLEALKTMPHPQHDERLVNSQRGRLFGSSTSAIRRAWSKIHLRKSDFKEPPSGSN